MPFISVAPIGAPPLPSEGTASSFCTKVPREQHASHHPPPLSAGVEECQKIRSGLGNVGHSSWPPLNLHVEQHGTSRRARQDPFTPASTVLMRNRLEVDQHRLVLVDVVGCEPTENTHHMMVHTLSHIQIMHQLASICSRELLENANPSPPAERYAVGRTLLSPDVAVFIRLDLSAHHQRVIAYPESKPKRGRDSSCGHMGYSPHTLKGGRPVPQIENLISPPEFIWSDKLQFRAQQRWPPACLALPSAPTAVAAVTASGPREQEQRRQRQTDGGTA